MNTRTTQLIVGFIIATTVLGTSGLAALFRHRAATAQVQLVQVRNEAESLRRKLLLQQPQAPDIVFSYTSPAVKPSSNSPEIVSAAAPTAPGDRIRELEAALQAKDRELAALQVRAANRPAVFQPGRDRQSWVEDLKRTDPERYKEYVKRREEQRKEVSSAFAQKAAKLLDNSVADTTESQQAERTVMLQLVSDTWKMAEQLYTDPPPEDRRAVMRTMRENLDTLRPMLDSERNRVFYQLAQESGYTSQDSQVFVDYINEVIETTSIQPLSRAMHHGPGGGGWHGGGDGTPPVGAPQAGTAQR